MQFFVFFLLDEEEHVPILEKIFGSSFGFSMVEKISISIKVAIKYKMLFSGREKIGMHIAEGSI